MTENKQGKSKLLYLEPPLVVSPSLAQVIGLNEAIILQQMHYWLLKSTNVQAGHRWVYNSYREWQEQFPFWSEDTIARTIRGMEKAGYVKSGNFNKMKVDKTKWYRIDYDALGKLESCASMLATCGDEIGSLPLPTGQDAMTVPETPTETPTEMVEDGREVDGGDGVEAHGGDETRPPALDYLGDVVGRINNGETGKSGLAVPEDDSSRWLRYREAALSAYNELTGYWPDKNVQEVLISDIAAAPDFNLTLWRDVITAYVAVGWNKRNVKGMVDFYNRKEIPGTYGQKLPEKQKERFVLGEWLNNANKF